MVYLFQHGIRQTQTVNHPPPLLRKLRVRKVFVLGLEPAKVVLVHCLSRTLIGAEHDAIGILHEDFVRPLWLPSQFSFACSGLDHDVGKFLQGLLNEVQVLRPAAKMKRDEHRVRMLGKHSIALGDQILQGGELRAVETPVGMLNKLLVALVAGIDWMKKCFRVGHMNKHRNAKPSAFFPRRIEERVVDRDELTGRIANAEAELFQNLQPARAAGNGIVDLAHHELAEILLVDLGPVKLREHDEAPRIRLDHVVNNGLQLVSPHAGEDDDALDVEAVHARDHFPGIDAVSDADGIVGVGVHIDHRKLRAPDFAHGGMKRGLGVKVLEQDGLLAVGIGGGLVAEAGLLGRTLWGRGESQEQSCDDDPLYLPHVGLASGNFLLSNSLKVELQSELDLSRITRRQRVSEAAQSRGGDGIDVVRIKFQRRRLGTDRAKLPKQEVRVVEDVEEFPSEFEMHLLANRKLLDQ